MLITPEAIRSTPSLTVIAWSGEFCRRELTRPPTPACAVNHRQRFSRQRNQGELTKARDGLCSCAVRRLVEFVGAGERAPDKNSGVTGTAIEPASPVQISWNQALASASVRLQC